MNFGPEDIAENLPSPMSASFVLIALSGAQAFSGASSSRLSGLSQTSARRLPAVEAMAKGFGPPPPPPPPKRKASVAQKKRTAAGDAFDALTSSGAPEYQVSVRTVDAAGKQSEWMPVGGLAVPRSNSVDKAVTMAIFQNEDERTPPAR